MTEFLALMTTLILPVIVQDHNLEIHPEREQGALDIRIHPAGTAITPPAELLLTGPEGVKVGRDPVIGKIFTDIPNSSYESESISDAVTGSPGPTTKVLYVPNPAAGEYVLEVIATRSGNYSLDIRGYDLELMPSDVRFQTVTISEWQKHRYLVRYQPGKILQLSVVREHLIP